MVEPTGRNGQKQLADGQSPDITCKSARNNATVELGICHLKRDETPIVSYREDEHARLSNPRLQVVNWEPDCCWFGVRRQLRARCRVPRISLI